MTLSNSSQPQAGTGQRALYISPLNLDINNGMMQRQLQVLRALAQAYPLRLDVLSLGSSSAKAQRWLDEMAIPAQALKGVHAQLARLNATAWYGGNVILCNKLKIIKQFIFPLITPVPRSTLERYRTILCYYPWAFILLGLHRAGKKVVVDLGDVMAERHQRIGTRRWISLRARDEKSILKSQARCIAISEGDRQEFQRLYQVSLPVVTFLPPDFNYLIALDTAQLPATAGYIAARGYQNEMVVQAIASEPFLSALRSAGIALVVAGGICSVIEAEDRKRIQSFGGRVLGQVPTLEDFYREVGWIINPVGPSTGVKIKSVEALLTGRTLVTTEFGADEGLRGLFGNHIELTKWPLDLQDLAEAVIRSVRQGRGHSLCAESTPNSRSPVAQYIETVQAAVAEHLAC